MAGLLYTWGRNDYGRCGLGDTQHREAPTQVPGLSHVVKVRGGAGHTLVITAEGKAVVFGKNYLGQLGVGDDEDIYTPQTLHLVPSPSFLHRVVAAVDLKACHALGRRRRKSSLAPVVVTLVRWRPRVGPC